MKEYYVLYHISKTPFSRGPDSLGQFMCIIENKDIVEDWCQKHNDFYYTIEQCELPSEI